MSPYYLRLLSDTADRTREEPKRRSPRVLRNTSPLLLSYVYLRPGPSEAASAGRGEKRESDEKRWMNTRTEISIFQEQQA